MKDNLLAHWQSVGVIKDKRLIEAFKKIPREKFILEGYLKEAYGDYPLPILEEQTISQPTTVMIMTEALEVKEGQKILEVGTGSGYQAALLSVLVGPKGKVFTTEIRKRLVDFAKQNLNAADIKNVEVIHTDGSKGYEKEKPYDRIIVTAAAPTALDTLLGQLNVGGILIIPVGSLYSQEMLKIRKTEKGLEKESLGMFRFVPLRGEHGWG